MRLQVEMRAFNIIQQLKLTPKQVFFSNFDFKNTFVYNTPQQPLRKNPFRLNKVKLNVVK